MIFSRKHSTHTYARLARKNHLDEALCSSLTIRGTTGFFYFVFIPAFITLSIHGHSTFLLLSVSVARALTHSLSRPDKWSWFEMWPARRIIVRFIFTLVRFIAWLQVSLHFKHLRVRSQSDSARLRVVHSVNTTRKLSRLSLPLAGRFLPEILSHCCLGGCRSKKRDEKMCLARLARDHRGFMCFSNEWETERLEKRERKKSSFKKAHSSIPRCRKTGLSQVTRQRRRRHEMCFHLYFASLFHLLRIFSPRLVIISKLRLIITRESVDSLSGTDQSYRNLLSSHALSLFSHPILFVLPMTTTATMHFVWFLARISNYTTDCFFCKVWPQKIYKLIRLERASSCLLFKLIPSGKEIIHLNWLYFLIRRSFVFVESFRPRVFFRIHTFNGPLMSGTQRWNRVQAGKLANPQSKWTFNGFPHKIVLPALLGSDSMVIV